MDEFVQLLHTNLRFTQIFACRPLQQVPFQSGNWTVVNLSTLDVPPWLTSKKIDSMSFWCISGIRQCPNPMPFHGVFTSGIIVHITDRTAEVSVCCKWVFLLRLQLQLHRLYYDCVHIKGCAILRSCVFGLLRMHLCMLNACSCDSEVNLDYSHDVKKSIRMFLMCHWTWSWVPSEPMPEKR